MSDEIETSFVANEYTRLIKNASSDTTARSGTTASSADTRSSRRISRSSTALSWKTKAKRNFIRRLTLFKSKATYITLGVNALQSLCFYVIAQSSVETVLKNVVGGENLYESKFSLAASLVFGIQNGLPALFYPIGGILGDVYVGRYLMCLICLFVSFFSYAFLSFSLSVSCNIPESPGVTTAFGIVLPLIALLLISMSNGVFNINWLTFGADQLINSPSEVISSYIYYWYWTKNLGLAIAILISILLESLSNMGKLEEQIPIIAPLMSTVLICTAIFITEHARSFYDQQERHNTNPIKQVFGVLYNAITSRPKQKEFTSAFRYGDDPPSGLDYARKYHDGKYTDEEVGDVKTFGRISLIVIMISGYTSVYFGFHNQATSAFQTIFDKTANGALASSIPSLVDSTLILILVPFWNNLVFPLLGHYAPNIRKRLGIGILLGALGMLIAGVLYILYLDIEMLSYLFFVPLVVTIVAESLVFVPVLEFIYAQSPDNMKGLLIGMHYFIIGVWATVTSVLLKAGTLGAEDSHLELKYYLSYSGVGFIGFLLFAIVSCCYTNRQRNNPITDIMRISSYYS